MCTRPFGKAWTTLPRGARAPPAKYSTPSAAVMAYHVELSVRAARDLDYLYQQVHAAECLTAPVGTTALRKPSTPSNVFPGVAHWLLKLGRRFAPCAICSTA